MTITQIKKNRIIDLTKINPTKNNKKMSLCDCGFQQ